MPALQSFGLTLLAFAVLISVLVFFHEMGHFLVAKAFNVKATRFSIGFGPRLFGFQWGETEYRVSALPLGGYVKFAGEIPGEELPPEDRGRGYLEQPPLRKAAIAFAGPGANFLLALVLSVIVQALPHQDWKALVGFVVPGSPAEQAGVRPGDHVVSIDGAPVRGWSHFKELIESRGGQEVHLGVQRGGQALMLQVTPTLHEVSNPLQTVKQGRIGIVRRARRAEVAVLSPDSAAGRAGLQTFDVVTRVDGRSIQSWEELQSLLAARTRPVQLEIARREPVAAPGATLWSTKIVHAELPADGDAGLASADMNVFAIDPGSAAEEAGLQRGDRVLAVDGKPALFWQTIDETSRAAGTIPLKLEVLRGGKRVALEVKQHMEPRKDEAGVKRPTPVLGASYDPTILDGGPADQFVEVQFPFDEAVRRGVRGTWSVTAGTALGIYKMFTGGISTDTLGGPLMIASVSRDALDEGLLPYLTVMMLISVSLGLMNLIPIPVLDGFHILSAAIEAVQRRPLSLRFREIANMVGVALVLSLMLFALKNDVMRKFFD